MTPHHHSSSADDLDARGGEVAILRRAFTRAGEAWVSADAEGRLIDTSPAAETLLGLSRAELLGRPIVDVLTPDASVAGREARRRLLAALAGAGQMTCSAEVARPDGRPAPVQLNVWAGEDDGHRVLHCLVRDDTEQVAMADALATVVRRLDESQRIAGVGSWEWDVRTGDVVWSAEQRRIFGVDQDIPLTYDSFAERLHPADRGRVQQIIDTTVAQACTLQFKARIVRLDGEVRWIAARGEVTDRDGQAAARMAGTVRDVTDSERLAQRLTAADARFCAVFERSPVGLLLWRPAGGISVVNAAAAEILGVRREHLVGSVPEAYVEPRDGPRVARAIDAVWRGARDYAEEEFGVRRGGGVARVEMTAARVDGTEPCVVLQLQAAGGAAPNYRPEISTGDVVTGLLDREQFCERLEQLMRFEDPGVAAVLIIGLDGFKEVGGSLGHAGGELVLKEAARRLGATLRRLDVLARFDVDEFAVLLRGLGGIEDAIRIASSARERFEAPFDVEGVRIRVGASIGIAALEEEDSDAGAVIRGAAGAMSRAKSLRSGWAARHDEEGGAGVDRLSLAVDLRDAIDSDLLTVAYQPIVDARTGCTVTVEALARWQHERRGFVPPDQFIALAEQTGLIVPLTRSILTQAARACAAWQEAGHEARVAVNLSMSVVHSTDCAALVRDALSDSGLDADGLVLEITESALAEDTAEVAGKLAALRDAGVRLSIDDFGTGYSAMSYLKRLPVEELKVDRSFVRDIASDPRDLSIVRSLVRLAHSLDLHVVAEGVESPDAMQVLDTIHCDFLQGYGIARPMPAEDLSAWLSAAPPRTADRHPRPAAPAGAPNDLLVVDDSDAVRAMLANRASASGWAVREAETAEDAIAATAASRPDVIVLDHQLPGMNGAQAISRLRDAGFDGPILLFTRFLTEAVPDMRVPLDTWPVSKADLDGLLDLLDAYRATSERRVGGVP